MIKKKVKIGLLLNIERSFLDWEIKLFEELLDSKFCEIKLIISEKDNFHSSYKIRSLLVRLINKFINIIERKFTSKRLRLKERLVKKRLRRIQLLNIKVKKKDIYDYIEKKDLKKIKKINLDLIFRRDLGIIKGDLLRVARYGVWSLHHGDNEFYRGQPAGFWECFHNDETTGVTLQKLNNILDGGDVIEKGIYGTKFFWKHNENFIKEKSVTVLLKGIAKLYYQRNIKLMKNKTKKSFRYYRYPNFIILFLYVMKKYPRFIWKKYFWKTFFQKKW